MFGTFLRRGALLLTALALLSTTIAYVALKTGMFMPLRQAIVEQLLAEALGNPVRVLGNVDVDLSNAIEIQVKDVGLVHRERDGRSSTKRVKSIGLEIPYGALAGTGEKLSGLELSGTSFEFGPPGRDESNARGGIEDADNSTLAELPGALLKSGLAENLRLSDIDLLYTNEADGWSEKLRIEDLTLFKPEKGRQINVSARAGLNDDRPVTLSGSIDGRQEGKGDIKRQVQLTLELDGLQAAVDGTLDIASPVAELTAQIESRSDSLAAFLQAIAVKGSLDGTASVKGNLSGPLNTLSLSELEAVGTTLAGDHVGISGTIDNLNAGEGLDISLEVSLAPLPKDPSASGDLLRFEVTGFDGRLKGSPGMFSVEEAHVQTSLAVLKLGNTGPISIDSVVRNADNTVGLKGVNIHHGPQDAPAYLELTGDVTDAIALSGISFSGDFQIPVSEIVGFTDGNSTALGTLKGTLSASDQSGSLSLDDLSAALIGTDLIALSLDLGIEDIRRVSDITLKTKLDIPDFKQLSSALGVDIPAKSFPAAFEGNLDLAENTFSFKGTATSGSSPIGVDLSFGEEPATKNGNRPGYLLSGTVMSEHLDPSDYSGLVSLLSHMRLKNQGKLELSQEALDSFRAALDLEISHLVTSGKHAGNIKGHLAYTDHIAKLAPVELEYLGGTIKGDFSADFSVRPAGLSAKGRVEKWKLGRLLAEIGHPVPFSSTLYLSYDVKAPAVRGPLIFQSLSGRISASLWGGSIPSRLLDLSGLNLVRWLFAGEQDKGSQFVCAVLPFSFEGGRASGRSIILETRNVQIVGNGSVDLNTEALDFSFLPRPKQSQLIEIVSSFSISGTMGDPQVKTLQPKSARAAAELVTLPLNLVGHIFARKSSDESGKPCRLPKTHGAK